MDMVSIRVDLNRKLSDYEPDYLRLVNSKSKEEIIAYQKSYPKSAHAISLQSNLSSIASLEEIKSTEDKKQLMNEKYGKVIKKKFIAGVTCTSIGAACMISGIACLSYGLSSTNAYLSGQSDVRPGVYNGPGVLLILGSIPFDIIGPIQLAKSIKMKKKIARGELSMNIHPAAFPNGAYGAGVQLHF
jgi:hypothetical protein